uniref:Zinc finger CW-type and PWWP domain containing 2 n=1 Tax=Callorhinchus milii TaxID=7868 RepID=A0A4W3GPM9_CALMI
ITHFTFYSWPSILCPDPYTGEYVNYDEDGDVEGYHTEFLGNPHTRTWIAVRHIESYQPMTFTSEDFNKRKKLYESAIEEAKMLAGINSKERLGQCQLTHEGIFQIAL